MNFLYRALIFRSGRFFRTTKTIIDNLEKKKSADGRTDPNKEVKSEGAESPKDAPGENVEDKT